MFVMSRDPVMLEDALNYSIRYEALLLGSTEQTQSAVLDPASYVYDDKGRKKESSVQAVEIHQDTKQRDLERSLEAQKALNDESQRKLAEQQRQLDQWRTWNMNRHDRIVRPRRPSTTGGSQAKRTVEANKATPDNTHPHIEENQVADAVHTPQDTHRATPAIRRVRISSTTVEVRDT